MENREIHLKIIDFIVYGDTKNEISVLLKSLYKHDRKIYNSYVEDLKDAGVK